MMIGTVVSLVWRLVALALGVGLWGWWLTALSAPLAIMLVIALLLAYGLATGWGSVVPVSAAISMAVTGVVLVNVMPPFWSDSAPYRHWAFTVLALWAISLTVACLLAMVGHHLRQVPYGWSRRLAILGGLLLSLWVGGRLYQIQWPSWVSWGNL